MKPISVTTTDASGGTVNSNPIIMDYHGRPEVSLQVVVSGTATYTVQQTLDNPNADGVTPTWFSHPDTNLVAHTASRQGNYAYIPVAIRLSQTSGSGSVTLTVVQAGLQE
ncbi:MAG: hypothetical protein ABFD96_15285 [Armatimonadia bacterium]